MTDPQMCERPEGSRANAEESINNAPIVGQGLRDRKHRATIQAKAALLGYEARFVWNRDGRSTTTFYRLGQARVFTHDHDIEAFLAQAGAAK